MKLVANRNEFRFLRSEKEFEKAMKWRFWNDDEIEQMKNYLRKKKERR